MSDYLKYLIWMMLFVIVIEMIFPDSPYRKYLKLVMGCILVYTMLKPLLGFIQVDGADYKDYVKKYQALLEEGASGQSSYMKQLEDQQESLEKIYQISMKEYIESQLDISVQSLQLTFKEGAIQTIHLVVGQKEDGIKIGEIQISDKSNSVNGDEEKLKNKIKNLLNNFYNVQVDNIYISVQKN